MSNKRPDRVQVKFKTTPEQKAALDAEARRRGVTTHRLLRMQVEALTGVEADFNPYPWNRGTARPRAGRPDALREAGWQREGRNHWRHPNRRGSWTTAAAYRTIDPPKEVAS